MNKANVHRALVSEVHLCTSDTKLTCSLTQITFALVSQLEESILLEAD